MTKLLRSETAIPVLMLALAGCGSGGGGDSDPGPGGNSCVATASGNVAGEPDITGAVTLTPSTVARGATVTFSIPIDADTRSVHVGLVSRANGTNGQFAGATTYPVATVATQTLSLPVTVNTTAIAGIYYVFVQLCSDYDIVMNCGLQGSSMTGNSTMITYQGSATFKRRVTFVKDGSSNDSAADPTETCLPIPQFTVQ